MQVFWVSGPVGRIRSLNLSFKALLAGIVLLCLCLMGAGSFLQFLGFRLALEYDPQIARRLGNLHTAVELDNLHAVYHARLTELEAAHQQMLAQFGQLQASKKRLAELLAPAVRKDVPDGRSQGGPYLPVPATSSSGSVLHRMDLVHNAQRQSLAAWTQEIQAWQQHTARLEALPLGPPLQVEALSVSSGFGRRLDPLTHQPAMHAGLDFEVNSGTPILAAGTGVVTEAGWDARYGHTVLLTHGDGYSSRYAHASALRVRAGQTVARGEVIALSGNSGRSTGPHLHFEIHRHGQPLDPAQFLAVLAVRR